jgi:tetratricopeptide (TPR) repeat protein
VTADRDVAVTPLLLGLAGELGASLERIGEAVAGRVNPSDLLWEQLSSTREWLLVLDNVDDPRLLDIGDRAVRTGTGWLRPARSGLVLVTSRHSAAEAWGPTASVQRLPMLDAANGARLLRHLAPHGGGAQTARSLSMRLGGLPLALYIAGSYLAAPFTTERSFAAYERSLSDQFEMLMGRGNDDRTRVTTTFEMSLLALEAHGRQQARPLMRILACFADVSPIPMAVLDQPILDEILGAPGSAAEGLSGLQETGLIETVEGGAQATATITVHPLVAETIRHRAGGNLPDAAAVAARLVIQAATGLSRTQFMRWLALVPHLRAVLASGLPLPDDLDEALVPAAARASRALSWAGTSATALAAATVAESALDRARRTLDDDHPAVFALRSSRAAAWHFLGRYQEAESEFRQILIHARRSLGSDHPVTLYAWGQVAHMMLRDGKAAEAETELRQVLPRITRALGSDDSDTMTARHNLAAALSRQGKTAEAETEYRLVLAKRLETIGARRSIHAGYAQRACAYAPPPRQVYRS